MSENKSNESNLWNLTMSDNSGSEVTDKGDGSKQKRHICVCKFPLLVRDKRDGEGDNEIIFYGIPLDVIDDVGFAIPQMEEVEEKSPSGVLGTYMKVTWMEPHAGTKMYEVVDHLIVAGCPEDAQMCDVKSIFVVYHPIKEWYDRHVIDRL